MSSAWKRPAGGRSRLGACSYKSIESILRQGLERKTLPEQQDLDLTIATRISAARIITTERTPQETSHVAPPHPGETADAASGRHVQGLTEQMAMPRYETLSFEERLGLLADRELTQRQDRRLKTRLRHARLRA